MKIKRFEELECWQEARKLMNMLYPPSQKTTVARWMSATKIGGSATFYGGNAKNDASADVHREASIDLMADNPASCILQECGGVNKGTTPACRNAALRRAPYNLQEICTGRAGTGLPVGFHSIIGEKLFSKDYRLRDQLIGAGISVMNDIAEGFDSQSNLEFVRFLRYSRRSVSEIENCLYIALDQSYITAQTFEKIFK